MIAPPDSNLEMPADYSMPIEEGERIPISLARSLPGVIIFGIVTAGAIAVVILSLFASWDWRMPLAQIGGIALGTVGCWLLRASALPLLHNNRLILGKTYLQLVRGKQPVVVGQVPYLNMATVEPLRGGIRLASLDDPRTFWPECTRAELESRRAAGDCDLYIENFAQSAELILKKIRVYRDRLRAREF
jgi:hypothetical protein